MLTQEQLKSMLHYDPETGVFTRFMGGKCRAKSEKTAGDLHKGTGYWRICIGYKRYMAHRLAFLYMEGIMPKAHVDHINGVKDDNRWCNLRHATRAQNMQNSKTRRHNVDGIKNVEKCSKGDNYRVVMSKDGHRHSVNGFPNAEIANEFACLMREVLHGQFARHA